MKGLDTQAVIKASFLKHICHYVRKVKRDERSVQNLKVSRCRNERSVNKNTKRRSTCVHGDDYPFHDHTKWSFRFYNLKITKEKEKRDD